MGAVGGIVTDIQGGKFGHGFISAGATSLTTPELGRMEHVVTETVAAGVIGGTVSELAGGKFANGAATGAFAYGFGRLSAGFAKGEWITPAGGSTNLNDYTEVITNGVGADKSDFIDIVNESGAPGYFNPSQGFSLDVIESIGQRLFGWAGDPLAAGFAQELAGIDHPMTIIGHSQGALTVVNAAQNYGLPAGSTLVLRSPAVSYWRAASAARAIGGQLQYQQPFGDVANLYAPSLNPVQWMSGVRDVFCGFCVHTANGLP